MEYYRRNILPDMVRIIGACLNGGGSTRRGLRRPGGGPADPHHGCHRIPGSTGVALDIGRDFADYLQTDDLFQLGKPLELPKLPELDLHDWPCPHPPIAGELAKLGPPRPGSRHGSDNRSRAEAPLTPGQPPQPPMGGEPAKVGPARTPFAVTGLTAASAERRH